MLKVHPDAELAPRDVVARAIHAEIAAGRGAFLDCREAIGAEFPEQFPTVYTSCIATPASTRCTQPIPVAPAEHYPHGRRAHRRQRPHHARRPLGLRRDVVDRRAWRQPARLQLAPRGGGLRRPRRRRHQGAPADRRADAPASPSRTALGVADPDGDVAAAPPDHGAPMSAWCATRPVCGAALDAIDALASADAARCASATC